MKLACEDYDDISVMSIKGELVADEIERFRKTVQQRFEQSRVRDFVLDCNEMDFIDSQGLESLLWLQDQCADRLGQIRLAGCHDNIRTIFRMTRLAPRFDCHDDVDAALKSLR
ncbi:MAG: STAS domain-containing protein [Phycisphaeraceae bacterium]